MSYWKNHVGPYWSHFFQSLNPFASPQIGILDQDLAHKPRILAQPLDGTLVELGPQHARALHELLRTEYNKFPKSQLWLSEERIRQGFQLDHWIGVGFKINEEIVGCVLSRPLGRLFWSYQEIPDGGLVDFFCIAERYRKKGLASYLLEELSHVTASAGRLVHLFQQEGSFFSALPALYQGRYVWRKRGLPHEGAQYLRKISISERTPLGDMIHLKFLSDSRLRNCLQHMTGDSDIYIFNYRGNNIYMCITNTFHRSKPEQWKMGEILWVLPVNETTPQEIQRLATETLVDHCNYDIVFLDSSYPYDSRKGWKKDAPYTWHIYNFNPGRFSDVRPYLVE